MKQRYTLRNLSVLLGLLAVTGIAEAAAQTYDFKITKVELKTTRSVFKDTDYAALSVRTSSSGQTAKKYLGDLSEGTHTFNLKLPGIRVAKDSNDAIQFGWAIVNSGHVDDEGISDRLGQLLGSYIQVRKTSEGTTEISGNPWATGEGEPFLVSFRKMAAMLGLPLVFANCDGPVAGERTLLKGTELFSITENARRTYTYTVDSPGLDSPKGCGKNSSYITTIEITRTADQ